MKRDDVIVDIAIGTYFGIITFIAFVAIWEGALVKNAIKSLRNERSENTGGQLNEKPN